VQYGVLQKDPNEMRLFPFAGLLRLIPVFDNISRQSRRQRLAALTSFAAKEFTRNTTQISKGPVRHLRQAPNQRTTIVSMRPLATASGPTTARAGWIAAPDSRCVMRLTGGNLDGAKIDAMVAFPARSSKPSPSGGTARPARRSHIDHVAMAHQRRTASVNLYFDEADPLLVRLLRYADTAVGAFPPRLITAIIARSPE